MAFEGRETLDDNMCNRFHFGRDILFPKVECCFTFLRFFGFTADAQRSQRGENFFGCRETTTTKKVSACGETYKSC